MLPFRWALPILAAGCLFYSPAAEGQQACPFTTGNQGGFNIAGTIVHADGNQPLGQTYVVLGSTLRRQDQVYCVTADDGRFAFTNLPAGKYDLSARKPGFRTQSFRGEDSFSTAIVTGPNLDSEHIVFPLHASAKLSGHALDEEGDPVTSATVFLFRKGISGGLSSTRMAGQKNTDSSGRFHFGDLEAGTYVLAVSGRPWYAARANIPPQPQAPDPQATAELAARDVAYPITYYTDSTDPDAASPITLAEGGAAQVTMTLRATPSLHIAVDDPSAKMPNQRAMVQVMQLGPGGFPMMVNAETQWTPDGLHLSGLTTGRYQVMLNQFGQGQPKLLGRKVIDLTGDAKLDLASDSDKLSISGQVTLENPSEEKRRLGLQFMNSSSGYPVMPTVEADGSFTVSDGNLVPGRYELRLTNPDHYIKSIVVKGAKYSNGILDLAQGNSAQITIVAGSGRGHVDGMAVLDDKPFPGALVLLLAQDQNHGSFVGRDQTDSDGTFTIANVPPGRYTLLAIDDGHDLPYRDPAALKPYLAGAQELDVTSKGTSTAKVNVAARVH